MNGKINAFCNPIICCVYSKGMIKMNIPRYYFYNISLIMVCELFCKIPGISPSCFTELLSCEWMLNFGTDYDSWLRITFDSNIRYRTQNLDLSDKKIGEFMISPDMVIMEVKANERVPYRLTEIVSDYNFRLIRVSKYCQWLETSESVPRTVFYIDDNALNK